MLRVEDRNPQLMVLLSLRLDVPEICSREKIKQMFEVLFWGSPRISPTFCMDGIRKSGSIIWRMIKPPYSSSEWRGTLRTIESSILDYSWAEAQKVFRSSYPLMPQAHSRTLQSPLLRSYCSRKEHIDSWLFLKDASSGFQNYGTVHETSWGIENLTYIIVASKLRWAGACQTYLRNFSDYELNFVVFHCKLTWQSIVAFMELTG